MHKLNVSSWLNHGELVLQCLYTVLLSRECSSSSSSIFVY